MPIRRTQRSVPGAPSPARSLAGEPRGGLPPALGASNGRALARRERARDQARRDILLAAAAVFGRRGYAAATLAELAEAAGFAPPSLYRYFGGKEEIFRSLVELVLREMDATFEEPVDLSAPLAARLEALLRTQSLVADAIRPALEVLQRGGPELAAVSTHLASPRAGLEYYEGRLLAWLGRNVAADELRHPPEVVARAFAGITFAFRRCDDDPTPLDPEGARLIVELALHGFAAPATGRQGVSP
jgi:AcrR family transcriptional regulator